MPKLSTKGYTARSSGPRVMATPCSSGVPAGMPALAAKQAEQDRIAAEEAAARAEEVGEGGEGSDERQ